MGLSEKEEIIQDALGILPEWACHFKIKLSSKLAHWRSPYWDYYHYDVYFINVTAVNRSSARRKAVKTLRKFYLPAKVNFRTADIGKM